MDKKRLNGLDTLIYEVKSRVYITEGGSFFSYVEPNRDYEPLWMKDIRNLVLAVEVLKNEVEKDGQISVNKE